MAIYFHQFLIIFMLFNIYFIYVRIFQFLKCFLYITWYIKLYK